MLHAHGSEYQNYVLLRCGTIQFGRWVPTFQNNLMTPSSQFEVKVAGFSEMSHSRRLTLISDVFQKLHADQVEAEHCHVYGGKWYRILSFIKPELISKWRCGTNCNANKQFTLSFLVCKWEEIVGRLRNYIWFMLLCSCYRKWCDMPKCNNVPLYFFYNYFIQFDVNLEHVMSFVY